MTTHRGPFENSYHVDGKRLIAGEYPARPHAPERGRANLRALLDAGVRTFIDLTEPQELDSYTELLNEESTTLDVKPRHIRLPIPDVSIPRTHAVMHEILDAIEAGLATGHGVYVHCRGGVGRTGTVIGCYLVRSGMTGTGALARVNELFANMERAYPGLCSPETDEQKRYVRGWRSMTVRADRIRGALIGLAVGDAVGTTVEFKPPGTFPPVTDMVGGGRFRLAPGQWTDDTSMALCLAESLVECDGFDARDQMDRYVRWYRNGHLSSTGRCFDIGNTTSQSLERYIDTGDPVAGSADSRTAGNGSLMRLAPVAMFFADRASEGIEACGESSRTTHGAVEAIDACRYFGGLLIGAMQGAPKDELLSPLYTPVPGEWERRPLTPKIAEVAAGSFARKAPPQIRGSGYVVESLEAALWAFSTTNGFREGCLAAVNLGDDADTTAAIYGQIAGAVYGEKAIPAEWVANLAKGELISDLASRLLRAGK